MILPETCKIVDVNIKPSNDKLKVISTIDNNDNNKLHYEIEKIILHNDYFTYSIIVESDEVLENIGEELIFEHRMYKTKKITTGNIFNEVPSKKETILLFLFSLLSEIMYSYITVDCYNNEGFSNMFFFYCFGSLLLMVVFYFTVLDWIRFKSLWGVLKNK